MELRSFAVIFAAVLANLALASASGSICENPIDVGPCRAMKPRFAFNTTSKRCELFFYGGCRGNANNFGSLRQCHEACKDLLVDPLSSRAHVKNPVCLEPPIRGPVACQGYFPRYTFNPVTLKCEKYIYGGCGATGNLFTSEQECKSTCYYGKVPGENRNLPAPALASGSICENPIDVGPCRAMKPRFAFNTTSKRCEFFLYGGCRGNANNFGSLRQCHEACKDLLVDPLSSRAHVKNPVCLEPPIRGPVACQGYFPRYTFNPVTLKCQKYIYGGCGATGNLFTSERECKSTCYYGKVPGANRNPPAPALRTLKIGPASTTNDDDICQLPPLWPNTTIQCEAAIPMWTYDSNAGKCVDYIYGGCHGSENLFVSEEACRARCPARPRVFPKKRPAFCSDPPVEGPIACTGYAEMFTFDEAQGKCVPYIYGLCGGTKNLFETKSECEATCFPTSKGPNVCRLPIEVGPCEALIPAFAFNKDTNRCEAFYYGGCRGNGNRFKSEEECRSVCGGHEVESHIACSNVDCGRAETAVYKAKGCIPSVKPGECCPSSWDCSTWDEERKLRSNECFFVDEENPYGKFYPDGAAIPSIELSCRPDCKCLSSPGSNATISCAVVDCPPPVPLPGMKNCKEIFNDVGDCCAASIKCADDMAGLATCRGRSGVYFAGEKLINPNGDDPCRECLCQTDGTLKCRHINCLLTEDDRLARGCEPVFRDDQCCPIDWLCPEHRAPRVSFDQNTFHVLPGPPTPAVTVSCPPGVRPLPMDLDMLRPPVEKLELAGTLYENDNNGNEPFKRRQRSHEDCLSPRAVGPCEPHWDKFYFDSLERECKPYKAGTSGRDGSTGNVFDAKSDCESTCERYLRSANSTCQAKSPAGPDPSARADRCMPSNSFRYNEATGQCEDYSSMGCSANMDSYPSLEACQLSCESQTKSTSLVRGKQPSCAMPVKTGNCRSMLERFYYDEASGICKPFIYSGCQGNANNYLNKDDCIQSCVPVPLTKEAQKPRSLYVKSPCELPKDDGRCKAMMPRFYFDSQFKVCRPFFYGGCGGNTNRFSSMHDCQATCEVDIGRQGIINSNDVCQQSHPDSSECKIKPSGRIQYWYNKSNNSCEIYYMVCKGQGDQMNSYDTRQECEAQCGGQKSPIIKVGGVVTLPFAISPSPVKTDPCFEPVKVGMCYGYFPRYYFNPALRTCEKFIYGGCQGNGNNFLTKDECLQTCHKHLTKLPPAVAANTRSIPQLCKEPMAIGNCKAMKRRYYYNNIAGRCEQFFYSGCGGNQNNFNSRRDCIVTCSTAASPAVSQKVPRFLVKKEAATDKADVCMFGDVKFNRGDVLALANSTCTTCRCTSPPRLTCTWKMCPEVEFLPLPTSDHCLPVFDDDGCCIVGYACAPTIKCFVCPAIEPILPNKPGFACSKLTDKCGCPAGSFCIKEQ